MRTKRAPRFKRQRVDEHIMHALIDFANDTDRVQFRDWATKLIAREPKENDASTPVGTTDLLKLPEKP